MPRILVIRGGAIGDFILTLPALALLRTEFPQARIEILGYKHIVALAEGRYYAHATRSIEYGGLSRFFIPNAELPGDLVEYFSGFAQVVSYLYDPDNFFEANLRRAGVKNLLSGYSPLDESAHATRQLARPLERLALFLEDEQARLYPSDEDRAFAADFLQGLPGPILAIHPGSGGKHKLWPLQQWREMLHTLRSRPAPPPILLIGGEADATQVAALAEFAAKTAWNLPLPRLAAILARCAAFAGNDSGISHLAAAVGTPSLVLFGPTPPAVWAPVGGHVRVLQAPGGDMARLSPATVLGELVKL